MRVTGVTVTYFGAPFETLVNQSLSFSILGHPSVRRLGWQSIDTGIIIKEIVKHLLIDVALTCPFSVFVIFQLTVRKVPHRGINELVIGSETPVNHLVYAPFVVWMNEANFCNASDILKSLSSHRAG